MGDASDKLVLKVSNMQPLALWGKKQLLGLYFTEISTAKGICIPHLHKWDCNITDENLCHCTGCSSVSNQIGVCCCRHIVSDTMGCNRTTSRALFTVNVECN